ncbi:unnamed protein product [Prunus armeniaca]
MSVSGNIEQSRQFLLLLFLQTTHPTALFISLLPSSRAELSLSPPPPFKVCSFLQNQPFIDFKVCLVDEGLLDNAVFGLDYLSIE